MDYPKFRAWIDDQYQRLSKGRYQEEREWYESALFHQMRQWLDEDPNTKRLRPKKVNTDKPLPMPVSNYFSVTIDAMANSLGAAIPEMAALADNYDTKNRQAADAAERAIDEANRESDFEVLNPILAQQVPLFGIGVVKDWIEFKDGAETVSTIDVEEVPAGLQCPVCGYTEPQQGAIPQPNAAGATGRPSAPSGQTLGGDGPGLQQSIPATQGAGSNAARPPVVNPGDDGIRRTTPPSNDGRILPSLPATLPGGAGAPGFGQPGPQPDGPVICPHCHQAEMQPYTEEQEVPSTAEQVPSAKLKSDVPMIFQVYFPRDCKDPNLSPMVLEWYKKPITEWKAEYPDLAEQIKPDNSKDASNSSFYVQSLRRLSFGGANALDEEPDQATGVELWSDWTFLKQEVQDELTEAWQGQPSEAYPQMDQLSAAVAYGVTGIVVGDAMLDCKVNYLDGRKPYTFFLYQKDVASPYPKGLSVALKPLQKQINRLDSMMERGAMVNGNGKWLIPITQARTVWKGDPAEQLYYDPEGDGKNKPEWIQGQPWHAALMQRREMLVSEFEKLGYTSSIDSGQGSGNGVFRTVAYMGAKAEESRKTQRFLWEQSHELRAKKLIIMCKIAWTDARKVKVSGFNNQFGMQQLEAADLDGGYEVAVIQDSSRPKTIDEKLQSIATLSQAGLIDPQDPSVKDFVVTMLGMQDLELMYEVQFDKSQRDLEKLKQGIKPMENPMIKWDIPLGVLAKYMQTEEYEELPQNVRGGILMYAQYCSDMLTAATQGAGALAPPDAQQRAQAMAQGLGAPSPGHVLHGEPGKTSSPGSVQGAAQKEGENVAASLPDAQPTTT